jgi:uncharacterized protein (DUF2384 family)
MVIGERKAGQKIKSLQMVTYNALKLVCVVEHCAELPGCFAGLVYVITTVPCSMVQIANAAGALATALPVSVVKDVMHDVMIAAKAATARLLLAAEAVTCRSMLASRV